MQFNITFRTFYLSILTPVLCQRAQRSARATITNAKIGARAPDGSEILDRQYTTNGLTLRYKISAPTSAILSGATSNDTAKMGLNVLLHGDGGASFEDFPNKIVQGNLMGVVVLAPNDALLWGGQSTRDVQRPDGVAHSAAVDKLIREELSRVVAYDPADVWFSGVSGGAMMLSGFFLPQYLSTYKTGAMLMCGGMAPPENRAGFSNTLDAETMSRARIHWESSQQELAQLKTTIPAGIRFYEDQARQTGLSDAQIGALQTADATPTAGHCAFDNKGFNSGISLVSASWSRVVQGGDGMIAGIGQVDKSVVGRENLFR
ncbi:protein of unknown function [Taphrina deformans PYCC 5710]|uniref:Uncharacterized protein n=1 Tax=Taphrina deformans (strain PYCC 5710 / ATCC 11124 / CBS 356.35 / IMI 108563 / JCM 9778 / NBRC 8474) TaxID=1097556 RepID=R4X9G4_TAPDE|nr:protein of unknown function [Taphrina deformans PYCC 5710]|eukprot:CCG82386.1 protein of unknown function [Taphrina deformans PYCC 5710]